MLVLLVSDYQNGESVGCTWFCSQTQIQQRYAHSVSLSIWFMMAVLHLVPSSGSFSVGSPPRAPNSIHKRPVLLPFIWYMKLPRLMIMLKSIFYFGLPSCILSVEHGVNSWVMTPWELGFFQSFGTNFRGQIPVSAFHSSSGFSALAAHNSHLGSIWKK